MKFSISNLILLFLSIFFYACNNTPQQKINKVEQVIENQYVLPKGYEILDEKIGDLDTDGIAEKVIVYNTTDKTEDGFIREIQILKNDKENWKIWRKSRNAILKSDEGGIMGDPFNGIDIEKGILMINVAGGSSWKWSEGDKYRFQNNEFELIGYSSTSGKTCQYWESFDFNLSTGKIIYKKEYEYCEEGQKKYEPNNEIFFKKGVKVNLSNRNTLDIKIISPKYKHELYL